ncbi:hypothetical protein [Priestia megaterium]|uniref:hypothetical protein n=1 Tax=Priestia megaterium TaxID=1404 RepID=UPI000BF38A30|nr:hypothetical protein [Priestia megaterium]PFD96547.1 hypothetical protein CN265_23135 [Priestia megaterium]
MFNNDFLRLVREQLAYTRKQISIAQNVVPSYIQKMRNDYAQLHKQIISPLTKELRNTFQKIAKGIKETEEDVKVYKTVMMKFGYPPCGTIDTPSLRSIAQHYNSYSGNKENFQEFIDEFMIDYYDAPTLQELSLMWEENNLITKRMPLLRNAIKAHNLRMFELVVPSVIPQLEGIIIDAFGIDKKVNERILKILLRYLLLENNKSKSEYNFDPSMYTYYKNRVLVPFEHGAGVKSDISRHAILHGGDTDFGKETISLKVILLFNYILESIPELKEEVKLAARQEVRRYRNSLNNNHSKNKNNRNKNNIRKRTS